MDDEEILDVAGNTHDMKEALRNVRAFVDIQTERHDEVMAEVF
jgi:hypothetical protein